MSPLERAIVCLKGIPEDLHQPACEPDPQRSNWEAESDAVAYVRRRWEEELLEVLPEAVRELEDEEDRTLLRLHSAVLGGDLAAVLHASGDTNGAASILSKAMSLLPPGPLAEELSAAQGEPAFWVSLVHARLLLVHGNTRPANKLLLQVVLQAGTPVLRDAALS